VYTHENFHPDNKNHLLNIGVIPDGARRWARKQSISIEKSYDISMEKIYSLLNHLLRTKKFASASIYFSSAENFKRSSEEIEAFCQAENKFFLDLLPRLIERYDAGFNFAGNLDLLPLYLRNTVLKLCELTKESASTMLYFCLAYNPIEELRVAFHRSMEIAEFPSNLQVPVPLDLVIRTGGANLLSNFLPIQSGYARLYTTDELFNDLSINEIDVIIEKYSLTQLKYGE